MLGNSYCQDVINDKPLKLGQCLGRADLYEYCSYRSKLQPTIGALYEKKNLEFAQIKEESEGVVCNRQASLVTCDNFLCAFCLKNASPLYLLQWTHLKLLILCPPSLIPGYPPRFCIYLQLCQLCDHLIMLLTNVKILM